MSGGEGGRDERVRKEQGEGGEGVVEGVREMVRRRGNKMQ